VKCAIFVVDDLIEEARSARRFFESHGHQVTIATSGKDAIEILKGPSLFDVTFLDLLMPDVNGEQVYQATRMYAPARLKRLVFFTGMAYLAEAWLTRTGIPVIEKGPASPPILLATVEQFSKLTCSRGPLEIDSNHKDFTKDQTMPQRPPSSPELAALLDEDMEINTDMIALAQKKGVASSFITELRIRYLHSNHKSLKEDIGAVRGEMTQVKGDVGSIKTDLGATNVALGTLKTEITTAIKTSFKWLSAIVVVLGGGGTVVGWLIEHFLLKK